MREFPKSGGIFVMILALAASGLFARTISVPGDYATVKSAVAASKDGDEVVVEDGFYFERNIIVDKKIKVRAKNLFGAVIYGPNEPLSCIFLVRAEAEISRFILKNSKYGILQRESPDVAWKGHDLAILNMEGAGISVNDLEKNVGQAILENIVIHNCTTAVMTNDARGIDIRDCFFVNCDEAFLGFDHLYFNVDKTIIWSCPFIVTASDAVPQPSATNAVRLGQNVIDLDTFILKRKIPDLPGFIMKFLQSEVDPPPLSAKERAAKESLVRAIIGETFFRKGNFAESARFYESALDLGRFSGSDEVLFMSLFGLARSAERAGDYLQSKRYLEETAGQIEKMARGFSLQYYRPSFMDDKMEAYELLLNQLCILNKNDPQKGYAEQSFNYAEGSKASGIVASLAESEVDFRSVIDPEFEARQKEILGEISRVQIRLLQRNVSQEEKQKLREQLSASEEANRALFAQIRKRGTLSAGLKYPEPCRFGQLRDELLDSETALLLYFTGEKYSFGFLATQSGVDMVPLPSAKIIGPWIFNYIQFLTLSNPPEFLGEKAGRKLYQLLIAPLEKRLTGSIKRLVILPDGILHYLPFETLISDSENRRPGQGAKKDRPWRFLIEDFEVSYALSASYLMRLLKRHRPDPRNMDLLAVANPEALHQKDIIWSKAILPPLAYAKKEIQTIAEYFPKKKRRLLIEEEAAEERIKELRLSDFAVLHFASHGFFDDESWWRSALILDHDNRSSEDGLLQPRDILGLYLNADLVVLSACETGKGKIETGEGLMSQAQAFFFAGARSLVTSVWNINDRSTAEFMRHFYSHLIQGSTKGQALRLAKLEMLNSEYSHPFFWAAFLLMGEYKSPLKIPFLN